jgi:large subunit ribosomal protein L3
MSGSIGNRTTPGRVFKGKRMMGRMGVDNVTTQNLLVHSVDVERNLILVKGAVPGATNSIVFLRSAAKKAISEKAGA